MDVSSQSPVKVIQQNSDIVSILFSNYYWNDLNCLNKKNKKKYLLVYWLLKYVIILFNSDQIELFAVSLLLDITAACSGKRYAWKLTLWPPNRSCKSCGKHRILRRSLNSHYNEYVLCIFVFPKCVCWSWFSLVPGGAHTSKNRCLYRCWCYHPLSRFRALPGLWNSTWSRPWRSWLRSKYSLCRRTKGLLRQSLVLRTARNLSVRYRLVTVWNPRSVFGRNTGRVRTKKQRQKSIAYCRSRTSNWRLEYWKLTFKMGQFKCNNTYNLFDDYPIPTTAIILSGERVTRNALKRSFFFFWYTFRQHV